MNVSLFRENDLISESGLSRDGARVRRKKWQRSVTCFLFGFHARLVCSLAERRYFFFFFFSVTKNPPRPPLLMLDITSQKWIYTEEIANPSGNMGMNQSGQTAGKITLGSALLCSALSAPDAAEIAPQCRGGAVDVEESGRKSCHNPLYFHSHCSSRL